MAKASRIHALRSRCFLLPANKFIVEDTTNQHPYTMINGHMKTSAQGGGDQMMYLAGKVMEHLDRKGLRQHPLAHDLCHSVLVELMDHGLRGNAVLRIADAVQRAIDSEVAYMDRRTLWVDMPELGHLFRVGAV